MNRKADLFLDKYKQLEAFAQDRFHLSDSDSAVAFLERRGEYRAVRKELAYCREVRNLLQHNPKIEDRYVVEPSDAMIALLDQTIDRVRNPQKAKHVWVPRDRVACRTMDDYVRPAMLEMNEHVYTHIPILRDGVVIGVFSENTLLSYLLDDEIVSIDRDMKFSHLGKYLPLDQHRAETFRFIGRNTSVSEIEDIFADAVQQSDRIGLIFVTESGKPTEKLLGIISAWDIAGVE